VRVFEVRLEGDARVVVSGEVDMATAPQLTSAIESLAGATVQRVVVDLAAVSFMDSSGISALCLARKKLEVDGTMLVLGPMSPQVESTLQMVGLDAEFVRAHDDR
jgi:anti-anti-sigma factor